MTLWDWSKKVTTEKIMRKAEKQISGGDVILLHDGCDVAMGWDRSHSVEATDADPRRAGRSRRATSS